MADTPKQDRALKLPRKRVGGRFLTAYSPELGLKICEQIAEGETLTAVCKKDGMPHRTTFNRWLTSHPDLRAAYNAARQLSAYSFEEEAIDLARELKAKKALTSQQVRACEVLLNQLRWSAAKRNKPEFSEKASVKVTVPIQINTVLDMGAGEAGTGTADHPNIYEIEAGVEVEQEPSGEPLVDLTPRQPSRPDQRKPYTERRREDEAAQRSMNPKANKTKRQ